MDCATANPLMIDELYGELAADVSAAFALHLASCEACQQTYAQLQEAHAQLDLPPVEVPDGLTEAIMARIDAVAPPALAQPAAPSAHERSGLAKVLSLAGAWAMRPQTAMAAVFLLMIGSSAWLLSAQRKDAPAESLAMERGEPLDTVIEPTSAPADLLDWEAAKGAHGIGGSARANSYGAAPDSEARLRREGAAGSGRGGDPSHKDSLAAAPAAAAPQAAPAPPVAMARSTSTDSFEDRAAPRKSAALESEMAPEPDAAVGFEQAMAAYQAKRYDEATAAFDALSRRGDLNAALWAARSVRDGHHCRTALTRFDHLSGNALGTPPGNEATMEAGLCYRRLGQLQSSNARFERLLAYDGYSAKARAELEVNRRIQVARQDAAKAAAAERSAAGASTSKSLP